MMILKDILRAKGNKVYTISPRSTLADVATKMVLHNCGSLVVMDGDTMLGIVTERDILRACAEQKGPLESLAVERHMTVELYTGAMSEPVVQTAALMTEKRIRHLPVLEDGKLVGMISIGDVVKAEHAQLSVENQYLKTYIQS